MLGSIVGCITRQLSYRLLDYMQTNRRVETGDDYGIDTDDKMRTTDHLSLIKKSQAFESGAVEIHHKKSPSPQFQTSAGESLSDVYGTSAAYIPELTPKLTPRVMGGSSTTEPRPRRSVATAFGVTSSATSSSVKAVSTRQSTSSDTPVRSPALSASGDAKLFVPRKRPPGTPEPALSILSPTSSRLKKPFSIATELVVEDAADSDDSPPTPQKAARKRKRFPTTMKLPDDFHDVMEKSTFNMMRRSQRNERFGVLQILGDHLYSLRGREYLNDVIIDSYFDLICKWSHESTNPEAKKAYSLSCYFFTSYENEIRNTSAERAKEKMLSWAKPEVITGDYLFVPRHKDMHWYLIVVDCKNEHVFTYDSMNFVPKNDDRRMIVDFLNHLCLIREQRVVDFDQHVPGVGYDDAGPEQFNSTDCGVFVCQYAKYLAMGKTPDFSQNDMGVFRKLMTYELIRGELYEGPLHGDNGPSTNYSSREN